MYTDFYGLREKPFELTPSPRFLYLGETHKEALALLTYGVVERKGFILLTGEVGTGKTTMIRALLANLDETVQYVHVSNPLFTPIDFMNYLASSTFRSKVHFKSKAAFLIEFEVFLKKCFQHQKNFILIIDEAQNLSLQLLEEIRLLSNMETADEKLINIFLVGQPELNENLSQPQCKPLLQRISVRHHIKPLDLEGTREYIAKRLEITGAEKPHRIFPPDVSKLIYQFSGGYPRTINILADSALLLGYSRAKRKITPSIIKECFQDMSLEVALPEVGEEIRSSKVQQNKTPVWGRRWLWAALLFALLVVIFADVWKGHNIIGHLTLGMTNRLQEVLNKVSGGVNTPVKDGTNRNPEGGVQNSSDIAASKGMVDRHELQAFTKNDDTGDRGKLEIIIPVETGNSFNAFGQADGENEKSLWKTIIVKEGDTFTGLVLRLYGDVDENILNFVRKHNPEVEDVNSLAVGQKLVFPPLSVSTPAPVFTVHVASFDVFDQASNVFRELNNQGYDVYIMPVLDAKKGKFFRVAVGNFESKPEAESYAKMILGKGVSSYAEVMRLEMR